MNFFNAHVLPLALVLAAGCGGPRTRGDGSDAPPVGKPAVLLQIRDGALIPLGCYDDVWASFRGPGDCAELLPEGAQVRLAAGGAVTVGERAPVDCGVGPGMVFKVNGEPAGTLAVWPTEGPELVTLPAPVPVPEAELAALRAELAAPVEAPVWQAVGESRVLLTRLGSQGLIYVRGADGLLHAAWRALGEVPIAEAAVDLDADGRLELVARVGDLRAVVALTGEESPFAGACQTSTPVSTAFRQAADVGQAWANSAVLASPSGT